MEDRGMNERIQKLRRESHTAVPHLSIERAVAATEAYEKYAGSVETPILRALTFRHILETKTLWIGNGELIVGEKGERPQYAPSFPELCCHTLTDLDVMNSRQYISFKVTDTVRQTHASRIEPYWRGRSLRELIFRHMTPEWKQCYENGLFTEFMEQRGPGHTVLDGKIYRKGFLEFQADIRAAIAALDFLADPQAYEKKIQLEAMDICCDAIMAYGRRNAELARQMAVAAADPVRRQELLAIAATCVVL